MITGKKVFMYIASCFGAIAMWFFAVAFAVAILADYANAATMYYSESGKSIIVDGEIESGDNAKLKHLITDDVSVVLLSSPGGSVKEGWEMAATIRSNKLDTAVSRTCSSACTYAFMGGVKRWVREGHFKLGYHPASIEMFKSERTLNDIYDMGQTHAIRTMTEYAYYVDAGKEYDVMMWIRVVYNSTTYKDMRYGTLEELTRAGIVTHTYN